MTTNQKNKRVVTTEGAFCHTSFPMNDFKELASGLLGTIVEVYPGTSYIKVKFDFDPEHDRIVPSRFLRHL